MVFNHFTRLVNGVKWLSLTNHDLTIHHPLLNHCYSPDFANNQRQQALHQSQLLDRPAPIDQEFAELLAIKQCLTING